MKRFAAFSVLLLIWGMVDDALLALISPSANWSIDAEDDEYLVSHGQSQVKVSGRKTTPAFVGVKLRPGGCTLCRLSHSPRPAPIEPDKPPTIYVFMSIQI